MANLVIPKVEFCGTSNGQVEIFFSQSISLNVMGLVGGCFFLFRGWTSYMLSGGDFSLVFQKISIIPCEV